MPPTPQVVSLRTETMRAPQTARGRATRQRLLDAAVAEFGTSGFHQASVSAITARAGIGQGTFYIYFGSKDACFSVVAELTSKQLRRALLRGFSGLNLAEALHGGIAAYLDFARDQTVAVRALAEARFVDPVAWQAHVSRLVHCFSDLIERHAGSSGINHNDREIHATAIVGALVALAEVSDADCAAHDAAALTRLLLDGLRGAATEPAVAEAP